MRLASDFEKRLMLVLTPLGVALMVGAVAMIRLYDGFGTWAPLHTETVVFLALWYAVFFAAYLIFGRLPLPTATLRPIPAPILRTIVTTLCCLAMLGAALLVYEFAVTRGYGFNIAVEDIRILEVSRAQGAYGSAIGGLGRLLTTALPAAVAVYVSGFRRIGLRVLPALLLALTVVIYQQVRFEGGRFSMVGLAVIAVVGGLLYAARSIVERRNRKLPLRLLNVLGPFIAAVLMAIPVYYYADLVTQKRVYSIDDVQANAAAIAKENGPPNVTAENLYFFSYANYANSFAIKIPDIDPAGFSARQFGQAMGWIYFTQSFNELDRLLQQPNLNLAFGGYEFPHLWQLASLITRTDSRYDVVANLPAAGTYSTFPGNNYIDFGWLGALVFALLFGAVLVLTLRTNLQNEASLLGAAAPILVLNAFVSPITSLMQNYWPSLAWLVMMAIVVAVLNRRSPALAT